MKEYLSHKKGLPVYFPKNNPYFLFGWFSILTLFFCFNATAKGYSVNKNIKFSTPKAKFRPMIINTKDIEVSGLITNAKGEPLAGVSVKIKDGKQGTSTDTEGKYSISVPDNSMLVFSFIGYVTQEVIVNDKIKIDIQLVENVGLLGDVVVSALGINRSSKSIAYSIQKVTGEVLNVVPQTNFMNSLSGKAAGVTISSNASGIGGSVKVLIRGNKSATGSNQPLYVIDGIPLINNPSEVTPSTFEGRDGGDGISNLNPDDIESMSILKGASAAALYGSAAANGVILINTKKGKVGISKVNFSSSYIADKVAYKPQLQDSYGQSSVGSEFSWGKATTTATDNITDFFKTGNTLVNAISFATGAEKAQTYISYSNTTGSGVLENNSLSRHNFNIHETARFLNNKLSIDVNANYIQQTLNNSPNLGYLNNITRLYLFPRGLDFNQYKNPTIYDPIRKMMTQNWFLPPSSSGAMNPYWVNNFVQNKSDRNRTMLKIAAKYNITNSLSFQLRGNVDKINDKNTSNWYAGGPIVRAGLNGQYGVNNLTNTLYYGDAMLNYTKFFGKIHVNTILGASINDSRNNGTGISSNALYIPNIFTIQNMDLASPNTNSYSVSEEHSQLQAAFGAISVSFNDWLFLDVTGRNDWSSNLSYTPNGSYFYPSAGISTILNKALKLPEVVSLARLRGSYAVVGNSVPIYVTNPQNYIGRGGGVIFNNTAPFADLNPEKTKSLELGSELGFFHNQISIDFTYYKTKSTNQFFSILVPPGTGYSRRFINAGNIENSGVELTMGYSPLAKGALKWSTLINFSTNKNVVKSLAEGTNEFVLAQDNNNYYSILKIGGSYGDIYGYNLQNDSASGKVKLSADSVPLVKTGAPSFLGNPNPKFQLGWSNSFSYKDFTFSFLVDGKFGGEVLSKTEMLLDNYGVSKATGNARDNGGVAINGILPNGASVSKVDAYKWYYSNTSNKVNGEYMYDATVIRIREASISYSLPSKMLKNGFIKNLRLSLIGRNLAYLYKPAPYDPEIAYSIGNGFSGVDVMNLPALRSVGVNLNITF